MPSADEFIATLIEKLTMAIVPAEDRFPRLNLLFSVHSDAVEAELIEASKQGALPVIAQQVLNSIKKLEESRQSVKDMRRFDQRIVRLLLGERSEQGKHASKAIRDEMRHRDDRSSTAEVSELAEPYHEDTPQVTIAGMRQTFEFVLNFDNESEEWHYGGMGQNTVTDDGQGIDYVAQASTALSRLNQDEIRTVLGDMSDERLRMVLRIAVETPAAIAMIEDNNTGLGTAVKQMLSEGAKSLTRDELRKLQTFAANRLKEDGLDQRVKERAIADDIFPPARVLFPDRIATPSDVDAHSLTALFRERADDPAANAEPLSEQQLAAIKDLSQAWRKHFTYVKYRGEKVNLSPVGEDGMLFRTPGANRKSLGTNKFWPKLEF